MIRRTILALAVSAAACAPGAHSDEEVTEATQAESLTDPSRENAIRFLEQATFGPRLSAAAPHAIDTVEFVDASGITAAIDAQLAQPPGVFESSTTSPDLGAQFFGAAIDGSDQLRLRVAFALSQIIVVSEAGVPGINSTPQNETKIALAGYFNKVRAGAFGSFRTLLETITRDPAMGQYLSMANNRAFDTDGLPVAPNENFARELLQLFTLGLDKLYEDGTQQLDCTGDGLADTGCTMAAGGMPIPAYTEAQVQAFAASFSGWTFAKTTTSTAADCPLQGKTNSPFYGVETACTTANDCGTPMIACPVNHDSSQQTLLRGGKTSDKGSPETHLTQALNNIANDPNVPPFVVKQLIQHLVTSNPTPAYVKRVVNVWKNSTYPTAGGVRGDLAAVVRAILVDAEARGPSAPLAQYASYGQLRSPALFITSMVRWLDGHLDSSGTKRPGTVLNTASGSMGQTVPKAPSVFSYYPPTGTVPGDSGLLGPEFSITSTATIAARANFVHDLFFEATMNSSKGILINVDVLPNDPNDMVVWLEQNMLHNAGSTDLQLKIFAALNDPRATAGATTTATQNRAKKKLAVTLAALSPEFQIKR